MPPTKPDKYLFALDRVKNLLDFQVPGGGGDGGDCGDGSGDSGC